MADLLRMSAAVAGETEAVLTEWLIPEGGSFAPRDVVATVETAKASFEVEAETAGVLLRQLVGAGAQVTVGTPLALTGAPGESADEAAAELGLVADPTADLAASAGVGSGAAAPGANGDGAVATMAGREHGRIFISPIARRLAREAGVPIERISGTGPNGRIIRRDVEAAVASHETLTSQPVESPSEPAQPKVTEPARPAPTLPMEPVEAAGVRDVPHSRLRRAIAARLTESKQAAPHFYLRGTADVERLCRLREWLNASSPVKITLNDLVIKAAAHAHIRVPAMNVIWTPDAVRHFSGVDLSVAIATDEGLVTPVIRGADRLSVSAIAAQVKEQAERARTGRLRQQDLQGGVATITNLGMFGTEEFAAIINPPQSSILAVGAAREEPVVRKGKVRVRRVMTVTLSVDHRPIDGVTAAKWMQAFTALLEDPAQVLA